MDSLTGSRLGLINLPFLASFPCSIYFVTAAQKFNQFYYEYIYIYHL